MSDEQFKTYIKTDQYSTERGAKMVFPLIRQWATDRNLVLGATPKDQMLKLQEEHGELAKAVGRRDMAEIVDGIGDMVVVLTILAAQYDLTIESCVDSAYNEIKDRKGRLENGIFIKEI